MRPFRTIALSLVIATSALAGCATTTGAVLGGVAGHAIGKNRTSTAAGAIAGGVIGHEIHERGE